MRQARIALLIALLVLAAPLSVARHASARGLVVSLNNGSFVTGAAQPLVVHVDNGAGTPVTTATVTLACSVSGCNAQTALQPSPPSIVGNGTPGAGAGGDYAFTLTPTLAGSYVAQASAGRTVGSATFQVAQAAWELRQVQLPGDASVGQSVTVTAVLYNNAPIARSTIGTLLAGGQSAGSTSISAPADALVSVPMAYSPTAVGNTPLSLSLASGERLDLGTLTVIPPATLGMQNVTASHFLTTRVPLVLHDANGLTHATAVVAYDPALVEVRGADVGPDADLGTNVLIDPSNGTVTVDVVAFKPASGDLTLAMLDLAAVGLADSDSTLGLAIPTYVRQVGVGYAIGSDAAFHGRLLGPLDGLAPPA